jgi:hypothetical protein
MRKLCPLSMLFAHIPLDELSSSRKQLFVELLTRMTHSTPCTTITAVLFAEMVGCLFLDH